MSQYYSKEYQNYYNKLTNNKKSKYISANASNILNTLKSSVDSSNWKESGITSFVDEVLNGLIVDTNTVEDNISNVLEKASDTTYDELVPALEELKTKDKEYEEAINQLESANDEEKKALEEKIQSLEKELATTKEQVDSLLGEVKSYNDEIVEIKAKGHVLYASKDGTILYEKDANGHLVKKGTNDGSVAVLIRKKVSSASSTVKKSSKYISMTGATAATGVTRVTTRSRTATSGSSAASANNPNMRDLSALDCNWKVVNTAYKIEDYYNHVQNNGICQDSDPGSFGDYCLAFAYIHSSNMKNGSGNDAASAALNYVHAGEFETYITDDKSQMLSKVYEELNKGNPVILQVNGNSQGTSRHFVSVVGYKNTVTSAADLKETDLLILDSWDGELERMDTTGSRFLTTGASCGKDYSGYRLQVLKS